MEGVGARLGRTSARYGPTTTFTGPVRKWRKEWVPIAAAATAAASSTSTGSGTGSRGNNLVLFKWTPLNGANGGGGGGDGDEKAAEAAVGKATRRRRYVPVSIVEEQIQEAAKSDDENKANDEDPSSDTEPSNGKTNINDTPMDESQASDEARDSGNNSGGTDLNLNLGPKDPDDDNEDDTSKQHETRSGHRSKRKSVAPDLEMRIGHRQYSKTDYRTFNSDDVS